MENASKALIIAGAILLSILIIGLGMTIFNQAQSAMDDTGLDSQKITAYNSEFEPYLGNNKKGTDVRTLIGIVKSHNAAEEDQSTDNYRIIQFNGKISPTDLDTEKNNTSTGKRYTVTATYNSEGLINAITAVAN